MVAQDVSMVYNISTLKSNRNQEKRTGCCHQAAADNWFYQELGSHQ